MSSAVPFGNRGHYLLFALVHKPLRIRRVLIALILPVRLHIGLVPCCVHSSVRLSRCEPLPPFIIDQKVQNIPAKYRRGRPETRRWDHYVANCAEDVRGPTGASNRQPFTGAQSYGALSQAGRRRGFRTSRPHVVARVI